MNILEIEGVTAGYDKEINVIRDIDLSVKEKESVSLIGANGAGKSHNIEIGLRTAGAEERPSKPSSRCRLLPSANG